jgi:hypothetical protein
MKKQYLEYSTKEQFEICKEWHKAYPNKTIFRIAHAMASINPTVEKTGNGYNIWEAHRAQFEKLIKE